MADDQKPSPPPARRRPRRGRRPPRPGEGTASGNGTRQAQAGEARAGDAPPAQRDRRDRGGRQERGGRDRRFGGKGERRPRRDGEGPQRTAPVIRSMEVTVERGNGFVIAKRTDFDAAAHKPVSIRYSLTREGLSEPRIYPRLAEARDAAQKPLEELLPPPQATPGEPKATAAPEAERAAEGEAAVTKQAGAEAMAPADAEDAAAPLAEDAKP